jgi:mannose-6-phosphate isomerase-like protein (cupin superfamily)
MANRPACEPVGMTILLTATADLATSTTSQRFNGREHGAGVDVSFFINHTPPGRGAAAHRHPYAEVFVIQDGEAAFVVDGVPTVARSGQVVVVPAGATHEFRNAGSRPLEMLSIHPVAEMETEWVATA